VPNLQQGRATLRLALQQPNPEDQRRAVALMLTEYSISHTEWSRKVSEYTVSYI